MTRLVSWNVNGLRAVAKKGFADIVTQMDADVFCVQETKALPEQVPDDVKNIPGYTSWFHSAEKKGYSGTALYSKAEPVNVTFGLEDHKFDSEGRVITAEYDTFFLINAYFPNAQPKLARLDFKLDFDQALLDHADRLRGHKTVIVCGDFNVAHKPIDLANPESNQQNPGFSPEERAFMDRFIEAGYTDTFRMFTQEGGHYTWWTYRFSARDRNIGWRIDYFCINSDDEHRVKNATIENRIMGSDHCPVSLELE